MSSVQSTKLCAFEGCGKPIRRHGYCGGHSQQITSGRPLKNLRVTKRPPRPTSYTCANCSEVATMAFKQGHYCVLHYRIKQMRYDAQASGKTIPNAEQIYAMFTKLIQSGMVCEICNRGMNWLRSDGHSTIVSLQHDRSGEYRLICLRCNVQHQHYPGDSFYTMPKGQGYCRSCKTVKPISEFYRHKSNLSGLRSDCKRCSIASATAYNRSKKHAHS